MEITILSKEIVKPSTPTPPHLRSHKLCLFDQLALEICITPIFFYKKPLLENLNHLKNTLSETLSIFYPLAGELTQDSTFVDCNDNGVLYVEALVKARLHEFLENPDLSQLVNFLPQYASMSSTMNYFQSLETLVSIQVTRFDCGGIAIGGVLSHTLLDGAGMSDFFNTWAKIARGDNKVENMSLDFTSSSLLFPAENHIPEELSGAGKELFFDEGMSLVRRFTFDAKAIKAIIIKASSESHVINPTRVEALTAFIWKHMILATRAIRSSARPCMVTHPVNLRSRLEPKLPNVFGNLVMLATNEYSEMNETIELPTLVGKVRQMIQNVNSENLKALEGDGSGLAFFMDMATQVGNLLSEVDTYKFSSWCRFGLYDVDFGWGKPLWIASFIDAIASLNKQQVILVENGTDGIEAWIIRNNEEMLKLENDEEFLAYASPNPSVHVP